MVSHKKKLLEFLNERGLHDNIIEEIINYVDQNYKPNSKPKDYTFFDNIINIFKEMYKQSRGFDYDIASIGKERNAVNMLLRLYKAKEENKGKNTEAVIKDFINTFRLCLDIQDKYVHQNICLTYISTNTNKLRLLVNGNKKRSDKNIKIADVIFRQFNDTDNKNSGQ